ncbi:hypothetical protein DAEQUDRAFT_731163 [Daedalea quercina L-15889]|uniref:Uncharacterized protein n=1 Tax=Daedalea quercina L-15889 TaxID=1314783 RepID=A0A165MFC6_9APHY|nr:hypothetical protein DAEQUDRAFT_731163 [Daedalea quercina L-15889]
MSSPSPSPNYSRLQSQTSPTKPSHRAWSVQHLHVETVTTRSPAGTKGPSEYQYLA